MMLTDATLTTAAGEAVAVTGVGADEDAGTAP